MKEVEDYDCLIIRNSVHQEIMYVMETGEPLFPLLIVDCLTGVKTGFRKEQVLALKEKVDKVVANLEKQE